MKAILILSLGGMYPAPPKTRRGTMESPIAAAALCRKNLRRETALRDALRNCCRRFTVPSRLLAADSVRHKFYCESDSLVIPCGKRRSTTAVPRDEDVPAKR